MSTRRQRAAFLAFSVTAVIRIKLFLPARKGKERGQEEQAVAPYRGTKANETVERTKRGGRIIRRRWWRRQRRFSEDDGRRRIERMGKIKEE